MPPKSGPPLPQGDLLAPSNPNYSPQYPAAQIGAAAGPVLSYTLPPVADILDAGGEVNYDSDVDQQRARVIEETLASFGAPANVVEISRGPTITMFGVEPDFHRIARRAHAGARG